MLAKCHSLGVTVELTVCKIVIVYSLQHYSFFVYTGSHENNVSTTQNSKQLQTPPKAARALHPSAYSGNAVKHFVSFWNFVCSFYNYGFCAYYSLHCMPKNVICHAFVRSGTTLPRLTFKMYNSFLTPKTYATQHFLFVTVISNMQW